MTDTTTIEGPGIETPARRPRIGLVVIIAAIAFLIGLALMAYAMRNSDRWFTRAATPAVAQPVIDYTPDQPQTGSTPPPTAAAASIDPAVLASRESALAAQLAALEARAVMLGTDAAAAAGQAGRAEAILVVAAARRALDRGLPLGYLEEQLRQRFGSVQPRATTVVLQASRQPVTLEDLRQGLDANASLLRGGGAGDWFSGIGRELRTLVVLHKTGTPSPVPAERMARARRMLDAGQVEAALAEVARLPGAADATAWRGAARRYVDTRRALEMIESSAILGQSVPSVATPPVSTPPVSMPASAPIRSAPAESEPYVPR